MRYLLITGVSSGIGKAVAKKMLQKKFSIIGISRTPPSFSHPQLHFIPFNLEKTSEIPDLCQMILSKFPNLQSILCNAGIGHFGHLEQLSYPAIQQIFQVNLMSHIFLVKGLLPHLKKRENGKILFIGSEAALQGKRKGSIYCASKFAMRGFAQALREECASSGVSISIIQPGMVKTSFHDHLSFSPGKEPLQSLDPEDIAAAVEMILGLPPHAVCDELLLSPLKKVISFKH